MLGGMNIPRLAPLVCAVFVSGAAGQPQADAPSDISSESGVDAMIDVDASLSLDHGGAFGAADSQYWGITGGVGFALEENDDSTDANLAITYHRFLIDDFEFIGEVGGWYFSQDGDDAGGINPGFTLRWHFVNRDRWTLYADAGIGLLFTTDDVPDGGSSFDFMPRAGGGVSFRLDDRGTRGYVGARWHHISNARINGDSANPDRDGVTLYGGVMFPF